MFKKIDRMVENFGSNLIRGRRLWMDTKLSKDILFLGVLGMIMVFLLLYPFMLRIWLFTSVLFIRPLNK